MANVISNRRIARRVLPFITGLLAMTLLPLGGKVSAQTPTMVPVQYDAFNNTIYVGANYDPANPAESAYVTYPSHPTAPKADISVPELDEALTFQGFPDLITNSGSIWTLNADTVISQTARLNVKAMSEFRLDSSVGFPAGVSVIAQGGALVIDGVHVISWANGAPDTNLYDGRSWMLADNGGRMDILNSEVSHLGWSSGRESGLSWRKRGINVPKGEPTSDPNIIRTGSTGSIINSNIHDNLYGQYSYEAYGLVARGNEFHHNVGYGFDPHDYSTAFVVENNKVHNNGKHGIIFSRGCTLNIIRNNEVWDNAEHGIMLDRGSNLNQITDNLVYNNNDGVAIFQSEKNLIQGNTLRDNGRGVRINATYDLGDVFDGLANENIVLNNTIENSSQYGIYLYERADKNKIEGNTIQGSVSSAIYIKTGGNTIKNNTLRTNGSGITILAGEAITTGDPNGSPKYIQPSYDGGHKNTIVGNVISDNDSVGIQLKGAVDTVIGVWGNGAKATDANTISTNGSHGISIDSSTFDGKPYAATKNFIVGNSIQGNQSDGVIMTGAENEKNLVSQNSISANVRLGINLRNGANRALPAPTITSTADAKTVTGTAKDAQGKAIAGATVEVYRDGNGQGAVYVGKTTTATDGTWSFVLPTNDNPNNGGLTALLIDSYNNTSPFSGSGGGSTGPTYQVVTDSVTGETTVFVNGPGANVTLPDIERGLQALNQPGLLVQEDTTNKVWMSNVSLFINKGVTLTLTSDTVSWLKLRSQGTDIQLSRASDSDANYNYKSFTTLRTYNGVININGMKITSWDPTTGGFDTDIKNGRSYLLAKYYAQMNITNSELSYLGSADGESYGISWRDINSSEAPDQLQARVTGQVLNSTFSNNYYGIYTYQASNMVFRGNKFSYNIGYGFDPHDYSNHFIVEDNQAFGNGNHGFIISRGCNNFQFRRNKSYDNVYSVGTGDRKAHGFMLDPGSPNSEYVQVASYNNLFENNEAWGNDGYGLRIVGSIDNTIRNNVFRDNLGGNGISLEQGSTGNVIEKNTISNNGLYGIYLFGGSDKTTISGNTITKSSKHGIYVKTGGNTITGNTITENGTVDPATKIGSGAGIATLAEDSYATRVAELTPVGSTESLAQVAPELVGETPLAIGKEAEPTALEANVITKNKLTNNADEGLELKGAIKTQINNNTISGNGTHGIYLASSATSNMLQDNDIFDNKGNGIRANGFDVFGNTWFRNKVYNNLLGGIVNSSSANNAIAAPKIVRDGQNVTITAPAGTKIDLYSDTNNQGQYYEAQVVMDQTGTMKIRRNWKGTTVNATATDADGNSSGFTINAALFTVNSRIYMPIMNGK